ncbi:hypothetical protein KJ567_01930 [Candidatus Bipolaricaulota bacterium]|nr:hypothetical protein [Candidatus Bipolaricaulota bacterium]
MDFFGALAYMAYDIDVGAFPMIAIVGFATYTLMLSTAFMVSAKRWSVRLRRVPVRVHRWMGITALFLATLHLLMGLSTYV